MKWGGVGWGGVGVLPVALVVVVALMMVAAVMINSLLFVSPASLGGAGCARREVGRSYILVSKIMPPVLLVLSAASAVFLVVPLTRRDESKPPPSPNCPTPKVDLVPKEVVAKWLKHLRRSFPAIAFKASTQENSSSIKQTKVTRHNRLAP